MRHGGIYSTKYEGSSETIRNLVNNLPVIAPFDFIAAFPSVIQTWVWLVMEHRKLPTSFLTLLKALYKEANAVFVHNNITYIIIKFLSGVLQGCPASGWLFNSALDPFLFSFARVLDQGRKGVVRACADDLSFALSRLKHLILLFPIYAAACKLAGLELHPKKCVIVPLCKLDEHKQLQIKKWLERKIPEWANFQIADAAKLLGFYVGPGSGKFNWNGPLSKLVSRVREIKSATAPIHINAYDFNIRVCPVLSYHAQLMPLGEKHFMLERIALHTVLRAPWNTFRHVDLLKLSKVGGPKLRSFNVASAAALFRTAAKTVCNWEDWSSQMLTAAREHLPVGKVEAGLHYPDFWDSPSFAHNLKSAFEGFTKSNKFRQAGRNLTRKFIEKNLGVAPRPGGAFFSEFKALQKTAYSELMGDLFPDNATTSINTICINRAELMFRPFNIHADGMINVELAVNILRKVSGHIALKVIKTWLNGWATSHRMHEDTILPCLFGCKDYKDSLPHYIMCPKIFAFQRYLFGDVSSDPLVRLGIKNPSIQSMQICSCLFSAYHAVKGKVRAGRISVHTDAVTTTTLRVIWDAFANVLAAEAGELRVATRAFSLPKFICFLCTGFLSPEELPIANCVHDLTH